MRRISVLEPSVLHLPAGDWHDGDLVAAFEQRWMDLIDAFTDAEAAGCDQRGVMSLALESLIWGSDSAPAWATDRDLKQRLLPVFYQRLRPLMDAVDVDHVENVRTDPALDERCADDPWLAATLDLLCWCAQQPAALVVEIGVKGTAADSAQLITDANPSVLAVMCHAYGEFLRLLPLEQLAQVADAQRLPKILELAVRRFTIDHPDRERVYELECSSAFAEQFTKAGNDMKPHILDAVVSRVTQTQKSAQAEKGLKDEPLNDRNGWRRCRVTRDWRIHYSYQGLATIRLETVGPHDMGL